MKTQKKSKKESLIPDINKIEEIKHVDKKLKKNEDEDRRISGPSTTRKEEKDPGEYPMKNV
jgi:hypothetical protein